MLGWIKKNSEHALLAACATSIVSILLGGFNAYETWYISYASQARTSKLEAVAKFDATSASIVKAGGEFIIALNRHSDIGTAKAKIQSLAADQMLDADKLGLFFPNEDALHKYMDALQNFSETAAKTSSAIEISPWLNSYDKLIEAHDDVDQQFYRRLKLI